MYCRVVVKNKLTTVGGTIGDRLDGKETNLLLSLNGNWLEIFPPMPTIRKLARAVCSGIHLIVAGGYLMSIDVLNSTTLQWSTVTDLPHHSVLDNLVVSGDYFYSVHSDERMFRCSTSVLIQSRDLTKTEIWSELECKSLCKDSTFIGVDDGVLSIGGRDSKGKINTEVRMYYPTTNTWKVIGDMGTPRRHCFAETLSGNTFIVVGGYTNPCIFTII